MRNIYDPVGNYLLPLLLVICLNCIFSTVSGLVNVVLSPEDRIISESQNVTLHCMVSDVHPDEYKIEWSHSHQNIDETLRSDRTSTEDTTSRTLDSSLTLFRPGPNFIASLYFCEVHSTGRVGSLVAFEHSSIFRGTFQRRLECHKSGGQGKIIYLFQEGPAVMISCKITRRPIVELRWKALHGRDDDDDVDDLLDFYRDDNGLYRYINSTLRWDPRLNGLIVYCKASTYSGTSASAKPCVIGLVKVVQAPRIIPSNTSISFSLVNEAEFWCEVRGLSRQACSYTWTCENVFPICQGNTDTLFLSVNETASVLVNEVKITCQVNCTPNVFREAHATLNIQRQLPTSAPNSLQRVTAPNDETEFTAVLESYSESDGGYILKCTINTTRYQPTFTWYADGERVLPNIDGMVYQQETHSYYRPGYSFIVVVCEILINTTITRVWSTFSQLHANAPYTSTSPGVMTTNESNTINITYLDENHDSRPSTSLAFHTSGFFGLSVTSRRLIVLIGFCCSMAFLVFTLITVLAVKRNSTKQKSEDISNIKTFRMKPKSHGDDTDAYLKPISKEQKGVSVYSSGDYAYPAFRKLDGRERVVEGSYQSFNQGHYEEIHDEKLRPQWQKRQIAPQDQVYRHQQSSPRHSSASLSSSSSSSYPSSSQPLIHEYHAGHTFFHDNPSSHKRSNLLQPDYFNVRNAETLTP